LWILLLRHHHTFLEGSHAHDHGHKTSPSPTRSPSITQAEQIDDVASPVRKTPVWSDNRERSSSYSSMYGHPVATRASVVQAAQDIASSGSPASPTRVRRLTSSSQLPPPRRQLSPEGSTSSSSAVFDERAPLLGDQTAETSSHNGNTAHHHGHAHGSMNMRALVLHVMGDALGNVGVIATGLVIWLTEWKYKFYFDPVISLVITAIIFSSALPLGMFSSGYILVSTHPSQSGVHLSFSSRAFLPLYH
jgi:zinc transporter 1